VPEINAFALRGGPMFVFTGLMKVTDNEAQWAGVTAHEMSHVILRHGTNRSKANLIQLPAMVAGAMAGNGSLLGQVAQAGVGLGANSVWLTFSRDADSQANALGSYMMSEAGYSGQPRESDRAGNPRVAAAHLRLRDRPVRAHQVASRRRSRAAQSGIAPGLIRLRPASAAARRVDDLFVLVIR
jgi:predicted Zn-dependent protease